jgi:thiamine-monophosphate kinase
VGSERALTRRLARFFPRDARVVVGIGHDAAVVRSRGRHLVLKTDPVVEGVHFARGTSRALVGRKAVNRNLSDLAAIGAVPDYLLVSLLLPRSETPAARNALFTGLRAAARAAGCLVVGGDVSNTPGPLAVTVLAAGHLPGRALRRDAAQPGDWIHVTGALGGSLLGKHLRFVPRLREGEALARCRGVHAAIDLSDGLLLDLETVLLASGGLGAELYEEAIPVAANARRRARQTGDLPLWHALTDGEDYELLFTVAAKDRLPAKGPWSAVARAPIGRILERPGLWLVRRGGNRIRLQAEGYEHDV